MGISMKWKQNKIMRWMILTAIILIAIPITVFAQGYSGTCIVTVASKGQGQVSPEGELSVWPGEKITFDVMPYEGYQVSSISINGVRLTDAELENVIQTGKYSLTGIYSNTSMEVIFRSESSSSQHTYTVIGTEALCGAAQDPTAVWNDMREVETGKFEAVYEGVPAGYYEINVAKDHGWTEIYGKDGAQNPLAVEVLDSGQTLKIKFDEASKIVTVEQNESIIEVESSSFFTAQNTGQGNDQNIGLATSGEISELKEEVWEEETVESDGNSMMMRSRSIEQRVDQAQDLDEIDSAGYHQVIVGYSAGGIVLAPETAWITEQGVIEVPEGVPAFFSIMPDPGYQVKEIYIDGVPLSEEEKESAVAAGGFYFEDTTRDRSIYVEFELAVEGWDGKYKVSVSFTGSGFVEPTPGLEKTEDGVVYVPQGQSMSLFFYPNEGYEVKEILLDGAPISEEELKSANSTNSFTIWGVYSDHSVSITFGEKGEPEKQYAISLTAGEGGTIYTSDWMQGITNGEIIVQGAEREEFSVFVIPDSGWKISQVFIDGGSLSTQQLEDIAASQSYYFGPLSSDHTMQVVFERDFYEISFSSSVGGSILPVLEINGQGNGMIQVEAGADIPFQVIPDQGYELAGLSIDGVPVGQEELKTLKRELSYTFYQVRADHQIIAAFAKKEQDEKAYVVTSSAGGHGDIIPFGPQKVTAGQTLSFSIKPDEGYEIAAILIDNKEISQIALRRVKEKGSFTFQPIQANHTIAAEFKEVSEQKKTTYQIYYLDEDGSEIEELPNAYGNASSYAYGEGITLPTQAPYVKEGYAFEGWYDSKEGGNKVTIISSKEKGDKSFYARWKKRAAGSSQTSLKNDWYGITVNGFFTALPELKVEQIKKGNTTYDSMCKRDEMAKKSVLAGYKLSVSGGEPDGPLNISFLLDERLNGEKVTVLHLTANGTLKNDTATVENGKISIQVNELGTFVMGVNSEAVRQAGIKELHGVAIEQEEEQKKNGMGLVLFAAAAVLLVGICIAVGIITKKKIDEE